jgi:hypothetical protein
MGSVTIQLFVHRLAPHIITLHEKFRLVGMMATTGMQEAVTRTDRLAVRLSRLRKVGYALSDGIRTAETAGATPAVVAHLVNLHEKSECPGSALDCTPSPHVTPSAPHLSGSLAHSSHLPLFEHLVIPPRLTRLVPMRWHGRSRSATTVCIPFLPCSCSCLR